MSAWLAARWKAFLSSFPVDEVVASSKPAATLSAVSIMAAIIGGAAFAPGIAKIARVEMPWVPFALLAVGMLLSLACYAVEGRGHVGALFTLLDQSMYVMAMQATAILAEPPISFIFVLLFGLMLVAAQARLFGLTLVFAVVVCAPPMVAAVVFGDRWFILATAASCAAALLTSLNTAMQRRPRPAAAPASKEPLRALAVVRRKLDLRAQWSAYVASVVSNAPPSAARARLSYLFAAAWIITFALLGWVQPFAGFARLRWPLLPLGVVVAAQAVRVWRDARAQRPNAMAALHLAHVFLMCTALALANILAAWPANLLFAAVYALIITVGFARSQALTLLFALAAGVPTLFAIAAGPLDGTSLIVATGFLLGLWVSYVYGRQRALRRQAESLQVALRASDQLATDSIEIALTRTLLGIGNFLHELRNAQTAVALGLKYLNNIPIEDEDTREALKDALKGHARAQQLVEKTLADLRQQTAQRTTSFPLATFLMRAAKGTDAHPAFEVQGELGDFHVAGDPEQLDVVLTNLVRNAYQAGAKEVIVRCRIAQAANGVTIEVVDDGPGLPEELLDSLFEAFTTSNKLNGTGLGLHLSKRAIELMGGSISAANRLEGGAIFTLRLAGSFGPRGTNTLQMGGDSGSAAA